MLLYYLAKRENTKITFSFNWTVLHAQCTCALSSCKNEQSSVMCLIASDICWDIKMFHQYILPIDLCSRLDQKQQRLAPWQTWLTQSMWVVTVCSRMLCSLHRSCLTRAPSRSFWQRRVFQLWPRGFLTVFRVFRWKSMQHLSETRRPASADRTARAANFRRDLEAK